MDNSMKSQKYQLVEFNEENTSTYEDFSGDEDLYVRGAEASENSIENETLEFEYYVPGEEAKENEDSDISTVKSVVRILTVNTSYISSTVEFLQKLFHFERHTFFDVIKTNLVVGQITKEVLEFVDENLKMIEVPESEKVALGLTIISCLVSNADSPPDVYINFLANKRHFMSTIIDPTLALDFGCHNFLVREIIADIIAELFKKDSSSILWNYLLSKIFSSGYVSFGVLAAFTSLGVELIPEHSFDALKLKFDSMPDIVSSNTTSGESSLKLWQKMMEFYKLWVTYCFRYPSLDYLDPFSKKIACNGNPDFSVLENSFVRTQLMHDFCLAPAEYTLPSENPLMQKDFNNLKSVSDDEDKGNKDLFLTKGSFNEGMNKIYEHIDEEHKKTLKDPHYLAHAVKQPKTRKLLLGELEKPFTSSIHKRKARGVGEYTLFTAVAPNEFKEDTISISLVPCFEKNIRAKEDADASTFKCRTPADTHDFDSSVPDAFFIPDFDIGKVRGAYKAFVKKSTTITYNEHHYDYNKSGVVGSVDKEVLKE